MVLVRLQVLGLHHCRLFRLFPEFPVVLVLLQVLGLHYCRLRLPVRLGLEVLELLKCYYCLNCFPRVLVVLQVLARLEVQPGPELRLLLPRLAHPGHHLLL